MEHTSLVNAASDKDAQPLYVFLDEGGNLDFSPGGTKYFSITGVWLTRPFPCDSGLSDLRFDLIESGLDLEFFHATEDRQAVRDRVFSIIAKCLSRFRADSVLVEKCKTAPTIRADNKFYPLMLGYLLQHIVAGCDVGSWSDVIVITDRIPVNKKRHAVEGAVKKTLHEMLPVGTPFRVLHHSSKSCAGLQIADYFNWAVYRKWERGDDRSLSHIRDAVGGQLDIFGSEVRKWY